MALAERARRMGGEGSAVRRVAWSMPLEVASASLMAEGAILAAVI